MNPEEKDEPPTAEKAELRRVEARTPTPVQREPELVPTSYVGPQPPAQLMQQNNVGITIGGNAATKLAEAHPDRLMTAVETADNRSYELAKLQMEIAKEERKQALDFDRERVASAREERKEQRQFQLQSFKWLAGFGVVVLLALLLFAAYVGDSEIVRLLITNLITAGGAGALGRASAPTKSGSSKPENEQ
jgi:hypothetical protein